MYVVLLFHERTFQKIREIRVTGAEPFSKLMLWAHIGDPHLLGEALEEETHCHTSSMCFPVCIIYQSDNVCVCVFNEIPTFLSKNLLPFFLPLFTSLEKTSPF